jgi:hypothetical protein
MDKQSKLARPRAVRALTPLERNDAAASNGESPPLKQSDEQPGAVGRDPALGERDPALGEQDEALIERIRERAYQLWLESGQVDGRDEEHWRAAEAEILGSYGPPPVR